MNLITGKQFVNPFYLYPLTGKLFLETAKMSSIEEGTNLSTILNCESMEMSEEAPVVCLEISDNQESFKTQLLKNPFPFLRSSCRFFRS
jgi:hypothetical protein